MEEKVLFFGEKCMNKKVRPVSFDKVETERIELSEKDLYDNKGSFKYFIGYRNESDPFAP